MEHQSWDFTRIRQLLREKAAAEHRDIPIALMVKETGIPMSTLYRYLTNEVVQPAWFVVDQICDYFGVKASYFSVEPSEKNSGGQTNKRQSPKLTAEPA